MINKSYKKFILFFNLLLLTCITSAEEGSPSPSKDPYQNIRYSQAFDQKAIYEKYKKLLIKLGCAHNVFPSNTISDLSSEMNDAEYQKQLKNFEQECLSVLHKARFTALSQPGAMTLTSMALVATAVALTCKYTVQESAGNSLAILNLAFHTAFMIPSLITTGYNLLYRPDNSLGLLEEYFAKNMCYVPTVLWPKIIASFTSARQNEFSRDVHTNFLNFTLNLTTHKPKPAIVFKNNMSVDDVKYELFVRINNFFNHYQTSDVLESINHIQINVAKFIDELVHHDTTIQGPRYIYLHGSGGIGKTHFVQLVATWIEELIPGSVRFEEAVISTAYELEGSENIPGALLKVLRNQLMQNKRGSIVMFDEATWLNDQSMISAAKRVFNGDRSKLSASFFGSNIDGSAISLDMPPILLFVASNDDIKDEALASRFDIVHYPAPTKDALLPHALKIANNSKILQNQNVIIEEKVIAAWIATLPANYCNFRYIAGNIENFLLQIKYKK